MAEHNIAVILVKFEAEYTLDQAPKSSRKEFAIWTNTHHRSLARYLFAMLDGLDIDPIIYQKHDWHRNDDEV